MKLDSLLGHACDFLRHAHPPFEASAHETITASTKSEPVLVFRGIRYYPDRTAAGATPRSAGGQRCVFRGIPYVRSLAGDGANVAARPVGVRIFRGSVVTGD